MKIIYDFDGTLTKYPLPQYPILQNVGGTEEVIQEHAKKILPKCNSFYEAYYMAYKEILEEHNICLTKENICLGAKDTKFNKGVLEYFEKFKSSKANIQHYIVTSGIKYYVEETEISDYIEKIYGVTLKEEDGIYKEVDYVLTDKKKVDVIKEIIKDIIKDIKNNEEVVYIGDGLTDKYAFEYVHNIGGKTIFVVLDEKSKIIFEQLNKEGIINKCFDADFSDDSRMSKYIESLYKSEMKQD